MGFPDIPLVDDFDRPDEGPPPSTNWNEPGSSLLLVVDDALQVEDQGAVIQASYWLPSAEFGPSQAASITFLQGLGATAHDITADTTFIPGSVLGIALLAGEIPDVHYIVGVWRGLDAEENPAPVLAIAKNEADPCTRLGPQIFIAEPSPGFRLGGVHNPATSTLSLYYDADGTGFPSEPQIVVMHDGTYTDGRVGLVILHQDEGIPLADEFYAGAVAQEGLVFGQDVIRVERQAVQRSAIF